MCAQKEKDINRSVKILKENGTSVLLSLVRDGEVDPAEATEALCSRLETASMRLRCLALDISDAILEK